MQYNIFFMGLVLCQVLTATAAGHASQYSAVHERCVSSIQRTHELHENDIAQTKRIRKFSVPVSPIFQEAFSRLKKVANLPKGVQIELVGSHETNNAFVLSSGLIVVSSKLWRSELSFDQEEAAAIIAHELAHLEFSHVKDGLCEAVALSGDEAVPLTAATNTLHRAIWAGKVDSIRMMQGNHQRELQADRRAVQLLVLAGIDPNAMARMLLKVSRNGGGDYTGTHPALEKRFENLGLKTG